jgi:hypothetical protein
MQTGINRTMYRIATGLTLVASCLLIWLSLGVGIIGADGDPANLMYFGVIGVGIIGAIIARLQPLGMAYTLFAIAFAQALVAAVALIMGLGLPYSGPAGNHSAQWLLHCDVCRISLAVPARSERSLKPV